MPRLLAQTLTILLLIQFWLPAPVGAETLCRDKRIIGQECWVHVDELDLNYLARVDTGATTTSLHATNLVIDDATGDHLENIGKKIHFRTIATDGESRWMEAEIAKVQTVLSAQGREKRYMVWLTLTANGVSKRILVNLRDRSRLRYKLLMGRDWLAQDFLVDVDMMEDLVVEEGEEESH